MKRNISLDDLRKVEAGSIVSLAHDLLEPVQAIIKVNEPDYTPACVTRRTSMSPFLFTAAFDRADLEILERDPKVETVSVSKALRSAE